MADRTTLLLCRGCCCGTTAKVPRLDHLGQEDALLAVAGDDVEVRVVELGAVVGAHVGPGTLAVAVVPRMAR